MRETTTNRIAPPEHPASGPDPAGELPLARLLGPESLFDVDLRAERQKPVGDGPIDRPPIDGDQDIGPLGGDRPAQPQEVTEARQAAPWTRDLEQPDTGGVAPVDRPDDPVDRHDRVLEAGA